MYGDDRFAITDPAVHDARHDLVALRVKTSIGAWLRYAVRQLTVAEKVIWRDGDLLRADQPGLRRILPVRMEPPDMDVIRVEDLVELRTARGDHDVRRASRRRR